jgi:hypothetical protein
MPNSEVDGRSALPGAIHVTPLDIDDLNHVLASQPSPGAAVLAETLAAQCRGEGIGCQQVGRGRHGDQQKDRTEMPIWAPRLLALRK